MHARSRRVAAGIVVLVLTACHGGDTKSFTASSAGSDGVKAACTALGDLAHSVDALNGVDVSDPSASTAALAKAVDAYSAALATFERVGPANLRARAATVRAEVVAHHFVEAAAERAAIDAWADGHCKT
jgi:hypothetical protein